MQAIESFKNARRSGEHRIVEIVQSAIDGYFNESEINWYVVLLSVAVDFAGWRRPWAMSALMPRVCPLYTCRIVLIRNRNDRVY